MSLPLGVSAKGWLDGQACADSHLACHSRRPPGTGAPYRGSAELGL